MVSAPIEGSESDLQRLSRVGAELVPFNQQFNIMPSAVLESLAFFEISLRVLALTFNCIPSGYHIPATLSSAF